MLRCLVTAGSSYVGRHIVGVLSRAGLHVDFSYRTRSEAVNYLADLKNTTAIRVDFDKPFVPTQEYEVLINSCGAYSLNSARDDDIILPNVNSALSLLQITRVSEAPRIIINFSSLSVYGWPLPAIIDDDAKPRPTDLYGSSKLISEQILNLAKGQLPVVNLRFPVVLGRGAHRAWLPTILKKLSAGESVEVRNPTEPYFACTSLTAVSELVEKLVRNPPIKNGCYTAPLGCRPDINIAQLVSLLSSRVKTQSEIILRESVAPSSKVESRVAELLGYQPPTLSACISDWLDSEGF